jgi:predicted acylesterase/phospholipase RssA
VLEELEAAGVTVDRYAGTSMGAIIAALAATGMDAAAVDANIYEYFIRSNPTGDYTLPSKGLIRGRRTLAALHSVLGERWRSCQRNSAASASTCWPGGPSCTDEA